MPLPGTPIIMSIVMNQQSLVWNLGILALTINCIVRFQQPNVIAIQAPGEKSGFFLRVTLAPKPDF